MAANLKYFENLINGFNRLIFSVTKEPDLRTLKNSFQFICGNVVLVFAENLK
jgi:hypothetical protein